MFGYSGRGGEMSEALRAAASLYNDPRYYSKSEVRIRNNKKRRQRIVRRQLIVLSFVCFLVVFSFIFMTQSFISDAQNENYEPQYKYYKAVTVHSDDTIWDIAQENYSSDQYDSIEEYISEICSVNSISDTNLIKAGESLIVPYYSTQYK